MRLGTLKDAAGILAINYVTAKRLRLRGQLPGVVEVSPRIVRVDLDILEAEISARTAKTPTKGEA
jgi:hypothetical protein